MITQRISILFLDHGLKLSGWHLRLDMKTIQVMILCTRKLDMLPVCGYSNKLMSFLKRSLQPVDISLS